MEDYFWISYKLNEDTFNLCECYEKYLNKYLNDNNKIDEKLDLYSFEIDELDEKIINIIFISNNIHFKIIINQLNDLDLIVKVYLNNISNTSKVFNKEYMEFSKIIKEVKNEILLLHAYLNNNNKKYNSEEKLESKIDKFLDCRRGDFR